MKMKTNKTIAKRFHITKNKKVIKRKGGQNHFNARDTGNATRAKRLDESMSKTHAKNIARLMPY